MKELFLLAITACILVVSSCKKEMPNPSNGGGLSTDTTQVVVPPAEKYWFKSIKNGEPWKMEGVKAYDDDKNFPIDSKGLWTFAMLDIRYSNKLLITNIPIGIGKHPIHHFIEYLHGTKKTVAIFDITEGDSTLDEYDVDTTAINNFIEIVKFDTLTRIIEGKFSGTFIPDGDGIVNFPLENPSKVVLTDGSFRIKLQ